MNFSDFKAELPKSEGNYSIVHQYALPQALIPIKVPSPALKIPNILEETVIPRPHPMVHKGLSGWKLSFRSIYMGRTKKNLAH